MRGQDRVARLYSEVKQESAAPTSYLEPELVLLGVAVALGALIQTAIGFGALLVCVTLGAWFVPVLELPVLLIPVSLMQTTLIVARHRDKVDVDLLTRRILPLMFLGMAGGVWLSSRVEDAWVRVGFGALVFALAVRELWRLWVDRPAPAPAPAVSIIAMLVAGAVHGLTATGGPLLVWALGRTDLDKSTLRTTLTAVWLVLGLALVAVFASQGRMTAASLGRSATLLVPTLFGVAVGEWLHHRVDDAFFRRAVWVFLTVAALPLIGG